MRKKHLLPPRGDRSACGLVSCDDCTPEINYVTCRRCEAVHDAYCDRVEKTVEAELGCVNPPH